MSLVSLGTGGTLTITTTTAASSTVINITIICLTL